MSEDRTFTATEVGTLIESFDRKLTMVAEGVSGLTVRMDRVEIRLSAVEARLTSVEDAVRVAIPSLTRRVDRLESKAGLS
jgi:hypothetical protein